MIISLSHLHYLFLVVKSDCLNKVLRTKLTHSQKEFKGNEIKVTADYGYFQAKQDLTLSVKVLQFSRHKKFNFETTIVVCKKICVCFV